MSFLGKQINEFLYLEDSDCVRPEVTHDNHEENLWAEAQLCKILTKRQREAFDGSKRKKCRKCNTRGIEVMPGKVRNADKAETDAAAVLDEAENISHRFKYELPEVKVQTLTTDESCVHNIVIPLDLDYDNFSIPSHVPYKKYSFVLDPFQKEAILCIERNENVLVSAHTSAGKTVVAEYAVAKCLQGKQRVIYTTPIKALSNQKYRDFAAEFQDVGLMTGDITVNANASCLIMTTEILRSMLYRGSEVTREIGWVIFDEIHYMRDKERGYVWEETLILLSSEVKFVFLSATIPNAEQFARWVCILHKQPCHVIYTEYRPTPLQQYIYPAGAEGIYLVVDETGKFHEDNFNTAMSLLDTEPEVMSSSKTLKNKRRGIAAMGFNCYRLIKMIMEKNFAPVIVFSFSKKECETYALQVCKLDFNMAEEKVLVEEVFCNAMASLSEEDRQIPQVQSVLPLLRRGIGIHHGGLLPILKETIEILFGEGLIKVLFATETFSMGLNMPARTVLFTSSKKFDGHEQRWITSGEYIQMCGRAGRRGKDDKGIVILMVDKKLNIPVAKGLIMGKADPINSAFQLTYNMVLNMLRLEHMNPEYILERSFFQFQCRKAISGLAQRVNELSKKIDRIKIPNEPDVDSYYKLSESVQNLKHEKQTFITRSNYILPFLQPGRLVHVKDGDNDFGWAVVLNYKKEENKKHSDSITICVMINVAQETALQKITVGMRPPDGGTEGVPIALPVPLSFVQDISSVRLKLPADLVPMKARIMVMKMVKEALKRLSKDEFYLDPIGNMRITEERFVSVMTRLKQFSDQLDRHKVHTDDNRAKLLKKFSKKTQLQQQLKIAEVDLKKAASLFHLDELKRRKKVLRRLGYVNEQEFLQNKGQVACELSAADELVLTEMIFSGTFNNLSPAQICALLSTFVCDERSSELPELDEELARPLREMEDIARRIARVCKQCHIEIDEDNYIEKFKPHLMEVVYLWCKGSKFLDVCHKTEIFEGSIIRVMKRIEELLHQLTQAAKTLGMDLEGKFTEGARLLKRDIVFAASLYL